MKILKTILSASILGLVFACGGNTSNESQNEESQPTSQEIISQRAQENAEHAQEADMNADAEVVEIVIEATDQMKFNKQEIRVKAGQKVK
ncbi:Azurin, partial [Marivirga lumbricoides]